jgi:MoxR-like ATPase
MTARDLLLRRTTTSSGETVWQKTPLLVGMQLGRLVILDGIDRLAMGTIAVLLRLIEDREATLFDGTRSASSHQPRRTHAPCASIRVREVSRTSVGRTNVRR